MSQKTLASQILTSQITMNNKYLGRSNSTMMVMTGKSNLTMKVMTAGHILIILTTRGTTQMIPKISGSNSEYEW